jgi:hypothetical protein
MYLDEKGFLQLREIPHEALPKGLERKERQG